MNIHDTQNICSEHQDVLRHWSAESETYAGADVLMTLLCHGWEVDDTIFYEIHWFNDLRLTTIYHFRLLCGHESQTLPVLDNPFVRRFIKTGQFNLYQNREDQPAHVEGE